MQLEQLNKQQFELFSAFIYRTSGIRIAENKLTLLSNRIRRRLQSGQDFETYYRFLTSPQGDGELGHFIDAITTNETFFFRTDTHFDWLKSDFLGEIVSEERAGRRGKTLRFWSAGCATGAEPYSVAICLLENLYRLREWSLEILGTDISEEALQAAREGLFTARAVEAVTEKQLRRYFEEAEDDRWGVRDSVRALTSFERHNLMTPMRAAPFDCIFIRNVLIYFDRDSKQVVVENLINALAHGGYLIVGPSEGIYDMLDPLERLTTSLYRRPVKP